MRSDVRARLAGMWAGDKQQSAVGTVQLMSIPLRLVVLSSGRRRHPSLKFTLIEFPHSLIIVDYDRSARVWHVEEVIWFCDSSSWFLE